MTEDDHNTLNIAFWKSVKIIDEDPVTSDQLLVELSRVYDKLCQSQVELDDDAKRVLYANLRRLYRR